MAVTHKTRYEGSWFSANGRYYRFRIYDKNYASETIVPLKVGSGGVKIKYDTSGQEKFSPIVASKCSISLIVENNPFGVHFKNFIKDLRETYEEGDVTIVIWSTGRIEDTPLWSGNILIDLSSKEDVSLPYEVELSATDGIGLLKNYDMVQTQGVNPYPTDDTYGPLGYQTFIYWIKEILEFCNTPDAASTDGDVADYTFSTSVDWWYEEHPSPTTSISPLAYTSCKMDGAYEIKSDGTYKVQSVYKVLESICKMWGMRVVFWQNRFYFVQLELYPTADAGSFAVPDNIESQIWTRAGVLSGGQEYLGETWFTPYSQDIETNAGGFKGGLQKLAGSKWNYYPKLKEVSVEFESLSNNNYFQTFPQPAVQDNVTPIVDVDQITYTPLGTFTGAASFGGFNLLVVLEFNNTYSVPLDYNANFSIRARPSGDTDWDNGQYMASNGGTITWENYPQESASTPADEVWIDYFISVMPPNMGPLMFDNYPNTTALSLPTGTSQQTIFSGILPANSNFTGDWEFEIFTLAINNYSTPFYFWYGHHGQGFFSGQLFPYPNLTTQGVTYNDVLDTNNNPISQFNPILSSTIGGTSLNTTVYSARSETQRQVVKNIWWGDTVTMGEPSSLMWSDGAGGTGYTEPAGKWRRGRTGAFDKSLGELLAESRLYFQQISDYKWSLQTAVSELNWWQSDGTAMRPVYVNPIGKIHDTRDRIFYYLLRGTFDILLDEWGGEWLQISYSVADTSTTTEPTGGSDPGSNTTAERLSGPSTGRRDESLFQIGSLDEGKTGNQALTSLSINQMNPEGTLAEGTNAFEQNTLIKAGDVFNVVGKNYFHQFQASADVANTATEISVESTTIGPPLNIGDRIMINSRDNYQQCNHKTRGSIGGDVVIVGLDTDYIKLIPRDFISNADVANKEWSFDDTGTTGVKIAHADTELWAFVPIPYGKKATDITVWGNNTKVVEAYELDVNASGIGTALGSGTVGTEFSITALESDTTNYLGVKVITTGTSNRIYGGKVVLENI